MTLEIEQPADLDSSPVVEPTRPRLLGMLGPGLITGASDDDPSGIATYSQAGAQFGYRLTWTMLFTYPLMTAVQIVSARIGRTTGRGLAGNLRQHCPNWLLTSVVLLLLSANAIDLGADLGAMADASRLILGGPQVLYVLLFAMICLSLQVFLQYTQYVSVLKWLTLVLFAYVATLFTVKVPWREALRSFIVPSPTISSISKPPPRLPKRCARSQGLSPKSFSRAASSAPGCCRSRSWRVLRRMRSVKRANGQPACPASRWRPKPSTPSFVFPRSSA